MVLCVCGTSLLEVRPCNYISSCKNDPLSTAWSCARQAGWKVVHRSPAKRHRRLAGSGPGFATGSTCADARRRLPAACPVKGSFDWTRGGRAEDAGALDAQQAVRDARPPAQTTADVSGLEDSLADNPVTDDRFLTGR